MRLLMFLTGPSTPQNPTLNKVEMSHVLSDRSRTLRQIHKLTSPSGPNNPVVNDIEGERVLVTQNFQ